NKLGARVVLSSKTTRQIMEQAVELSYTDSCFPFKLAHGHVASLKDVDYILYPSAIRLGVKEGDEDQKYSCPLVQASPYIIREVMDLGQKLLSPIIDFSLGDAEVIKNLTDAAVRMGFSRGQGRRAARAGLEAQQSFEAERRKLGAALLERIRKGDELGVVLLSRSYMSQDSGANLGIAEKLAQLGVVPVPLDFLPLHTVNPRDYSDRPFWSYESKLIAAAAIIAQSPRLYGLALTNFGCGPNSFILKLLEDIMGGKPMGQMEIDEHAAEAGIVTRLEAFVDTIRSYAASAMPQHVPTESIHRGSTSVTTARKTLVVPRMAPFVDIIAALMRSRGVEVITLPAPDERSLAYANGVTSGTECLPYRVTLGDFLKFCYENPGMTGDVELMMASSYGPCRLGKYALEQSRIMQEAGFDIPIRSTVSNSAYRDLNLGADTLRIAMQGIFAVDFLEKMLWRSRPYEKEKGLADNLFGEYLNLMCRSIGKNGDLTAVLKKASAAFGSAMDTGLPRRPLVGINGEIYLRSNTFSNNNMVRVCEDAGLEVVVSPIGEWIKYTSYRHLEDTIRFRKIRKILGSHIKNEIIKGDERRVQACSGELLDGREPSISEVLDRTKPYLSPRCGSEAVLSIGAGIEWIESARFAGVISVMPHGCMPGGIVAALADKLGQKYHKPWISLTYDGIHESNNAARINEFAELVKFSGAAARVLDK
ncbi:MAG TPA: acyl-CoA dehydratase activase-related protein, partial [Dehalococcoidia bacterium]|nr:acyl-CoA dehydratase activase-related protein [Dehalococcoidia bacterium]